MKFKVLFIALFMMLNSQAQETTKKPHKPKSKPVKVEGVFATISTTKGDIVLQLEYQKTPVTVANFISLAEGKNEFVTDEKLKGKPFYNGLKFHRVIKDFMIQGGDPQGTGSGGPGYKFKDEIVADLKFDKGGILAMANAGPKTNGSQIFITHKETPWLNGKHTIFGHVTQGQEIVDSIAQGDIIKEIKITSVGSTAKKFKAEKVFADYFKNKEVEERKEAEAKAEADRVKKEKLEKVMAEKKAYLDNAKASATPTPSGLQYKIVQKGNGVKPVEGTTLYFHYAGYFADGNLFDSSYEETAKAYDKYDERRAAQKGYNAFPFQAGKKDGMIPGFIEGINLLSYGDKAVVFIPSALAYGERGAGGAIPPNTDLIFEIEIFEKQPAAE